MRGTFPTTRTPRFSAPAQLGAIVLVLVFTVVVASAIGAQEIDETPPEGEASELFDDPFAVSEDPFADDPFEDPFADPSSDDDGIVAGSGLHGCLDGAKAGCEAVAAWVVVDVQGSGFRL